MYQHKISNCVPRQLWQVIKLQLQKTGRIHSRGYTDIIESFLVTM